jgi:hypothetical protein
MRPFNKKYRDRFLLKNNSGGALVLTMVIVGIFSIVLLISTQLADQMEKRVSSNRLKNIFFRQEQIAKNLVDQFSILNCTDAQVNQDNTNIEECSVDYQFLKNHINYVVSSCTLADEYPTAECGVIIDPNSAIATQGSIKLKDLPGSKIEFNLIYSGKNAPQFRPPFHRKIERTFDLLKSSNKGLLGCLDPARPFLKKIENNKVECAAISATKSCDTPLEDGVSSQGRFVQSISSDVDGLNNNDEYFSVSCGQFEASKSCPALQFMSNYKWLGGTNYSLECQPFLDQKNYRLSGKYRRKN